jgi:NitT/TauT family transport system ATP-binding protein
MVFQKYTSFPWLTVSRNIEYGLRINGFPDKERRETVARLIEAVGLGGFASAYPDTLSGGMQQRVAIARTLALRPSVMLMDEPFGALDAQTRGDMQELLLRIWAESASTVLFVTHDVDEAIYLADRIYVLCARPGTIIEDVPVPFGRPRDASMKQSQTFHELQQHVLACLRRAPGQGQVRVSV